MRGRGVESSKQQLSADGRRGKPGASSTPFPPRPCEAPALFQAGGGRYVAVFGHNCWCCAEGAQPQAERRLATAAQEAAAPSQAPKAPDSLRQQAHKAEGRRVERARRPELEGDPRENGQPPTSSLTRTRCSGVTERARARGWRVSSLDGRRFWDTACRVVVTTLL